MSPELEGRIFKSVLKDVMWDTNREEIFDMLRVNGITGEAAEEMYQQARRERIATIRGDGLRKLWQGALTLSTGFGLYQGLVVPGTFVVTRIGIISGGIFAAGLGLFLSGLMKVLSAGRKRGHVGDDE